MQDKTIISAKKIPVQMVQTKLATAIKNGPNGERRFNRLIDSANKHAAQLIPKAAEKAAWCAVTIEADLVMIHLNLKDVSKAYAYLFSFDEFYTKEDLEELDNDKNYRGYNLISHSLMGYPDEKTLVSIQSLRDD